MLPIYLKILLVKEHFWWLSSRTAIQTMWSILLWGRQDRLGWIFSEFLTPWIMWTTSSLVWMLYMLLGVWQRAQSATLGISQILSAKRYLPLIFWCRGIQILDPVKSKAACIHGFSSFAIVSWGRFLCLISIQCGHMGTDNKFKSRIQCLPADLM